MRFKDIENYNWDNGFDQFRPIIDNNQTDIATVLLIYWRMGGPYINDGANEEAYKIVKKIGDRILSGFYSSPQNDYDPISDNQLSKIQVHLLTKNGLDKIFLTKVFRGV